MIHHAALIAEALSTPWALERTHLQTLASVLARAATGRQAPPSAIEEAANIRSARETRRKTIAANIGAGATVIPVYGVITHRANMFNDVSGMTSCQQISQALQEAQADRAVSSIILDIDSPGGSVAGIQELADEIFQANGRKPITAVANSLAASAAYWLGSQAARFYVTPSGSVGSIGVYAAHEDWSKAHEREGIKVTLVSAGKYKTEGNVYEALSSGARAHMQKTIDEYYSTFVRQVARGRGVPVANVRYGFGEGRVLAAQDALAANMVDGIKPFREIASAAVRGEAIADAGEMRRMRGAAAARARELEVLQLSLDR